MAETKGEAKLAGLLSGLDVVVKVAFPILLGISTWALTSVLDHEKRITVIEARSEEMQSLQDEVAKVVTSSAVSSQRLMDMDRRLGELLVEVRAIANGRDRDK
jgi:hypothetical protein